MKPNRTTTCDIDENMSLDQIDALIDRLNNLRRDKLTRRANAHTKRLNNIACDIMDDGFVIYYDGRQIEPSGLEVRID